MDDIPVKISETCRPPVRVHLPAAFRQLPPLPSHQFTLSTERNILHWITERRKNFVDQRHERHRRLLAKQEAAELRAAASSSSGGGATAVAAVAVNGECCDTVAPLAPPLFANGGGAEGGETESPPAQQARLPPALSRHSQSEQSDSSSGPLHTGADSVRDAENVSLCPASSAAPSAAPSAAVADDDDSDKTLASDNATGDGGTAAAAAAAVTANGVASVGVPGAVAGGGGGARVGLCMNGVAGGASHNSPDSVKSDVGAVASTSDTATAILPVTTNTHHQHTSAQTPVSLHNPPALSSYTALSNSPALPNSLGLHSFPALPGSAALSQVPTSVHSAAVAQSVAPSPSVLSPPPPVECVSQCDAVLLPVTGAAASSPASSVSVAPLSAAQPTVAPTAAATTAVVFNVAEFESQASDPFDSAQLRSLDDMKELAAIFQRSAALASAGGESNGGSQQRQQQQRQQQHHQQHQQRQQRQSAVAAPPATRLQLVQLAAAGGTVAVGTAGTTGAAGLSSVPGASHYAGPVRRPCVSVAPVAQLAPMTGANTSGPGAVCCASPALPQQQQHQQQAATTAGSGGGGGVSSRDPAELRALQDFYTRYYQPISGQPLRSCRSVPDLADTGATSGAAQSHSVRPSPPRHPVSDGSSHAGTLNDRLSPETPAEVTAASCGVDEATFRRLRQIGEMGFPVQRLVRFHKHFGGDEKKVIDGALVARSLQGQYPEPIVELAVCEQGSSQLQHVLAYCHLLHQLHSCGFRLQRVAAVLRHTGLDQERALDALLTD